MQVTDLFTDDDAVSSVVSTVLMVAITVILVAVIGSFVLDLGRAVDGTSPQARLSVVEQQMADGNTSVIVSHEGGSTLEKEQVTVTVEGGVARNESGNVVWGGSGEITAGDEVNITKYGSSPTRLSTNDRVLVVWESENGGESYRLFEHTIRT